MHYFKPHKVRRFVTDITPELVRDMGCTVVAIDADNTTSHDRTTEPLPGTEAWIASMKAAGFPVILLSNAKVGRAQVLADRYDIPVVGMSMKPLRQGYLRAAFKTRTSPRNILVLGDQLFTDVLGGNRTGCRTIWVLPYEKDRQNQGYFAVKRAAEKVFRAFWKLTGSWEKLQK